MLFPLLLFPFWDPGSQDPNILQICLSFNCNIYKLSCYFLWRSFLHFYNLLLKKIVFPLLLFPFPKPFINCHAISSAALSFTCNIHKLSVIYYTTLPITCIFYFLLFLLLIFYSPIWLISCLYMSSAALSFTCTFGHFLALSSASIPFIYTIIKLACYFFCCSSIHKLDLSQVWNFLQQSYSFSFLLDPVNLISINLETFNWSAIFIFN